MDELWPFHIEIRQALAPLVIGVTGHRDLRVKDREILSQRVRAFLIDLKLNYPHTPLIILSALAEGADRLVAQVALEREILARLLVPLPMPKHFYEQDFQEPGSLEEFNALLRQAERWFVLPLHTGITEQGLARPEQRQRQYQDVGEFIARESQILIALWDGTDTDLGGGTAQVVHFQIEGVPNSDECNLEPPEAFPVLQIVTPRLSNPTPIGEPFGLRMHYPEVFKNDQDGAKRYYSGMFSRLNAFNRSVTESARADLGKVKKSMRDVFPDLAESELSTSQKTALQRYAFADVFAVDFQSRTKHVQQTLHWSVLLAFICFLFQAHLPGLARVSTTAHWPWWLCFSLGFLLCGEYEYIRAEQLAVDTNYQDYRALAEGMRVRLFWDLAGVVGRITAYYFTKQRTELDWIRSGLRGWYLDSERAIDGLSGRTGIRQSYGVELALSRWVDDQRVYFKTAAERDGRTGRRMEGQVQALVGGALTVAGLLAIVMFTPWGKNVFENEWLRAIPIVLVEGLLASGALLHHYKEQMAFSEHAKQYRRMQGIFDRASDLINQALRLGNLKTAQECLRNLGREALAENGDWVLIHRERPLELPHP